MRSSHDDGRPGQPAGFHRHRQPAIDHGAIAESILQDQPSPDAQSHHRPEQADDLANYILSLKRN
jgi:hypothetical protein